MGVSNLSRRGFLGAALTGGAGLMLSGASGRLISRALAFGGSVGTRCASLNDIQHIVILMQENRSFDHYFGAYPGVAGFSDPAVLTQSARGGQPIWYQYGWGPGDPAPNSADFLLPFHLDTAHTNAECTADITHAWVAQHQSWNNGAMDRFVATHTASDGVVAGPMTMGYYTRQDLGFYYALADAFTICDHYHCSVLGPTVPNRVLSMSGTIDVDSTLGGGPIVENPSDSEPLLPGTGTPSLRWKTMPEALEEAGVSWKFYQPPGSQARDTFSNNPLIYFPQYRTPVSSLFLKGIAPSFPGDFQLDVAAGRLPQVSWIAATSGLDEHPPAPVPFGELLVTKLVLSTLLANPSVWEKTVLFVTYDENGGFFDHVPPPIPPANTLGEWIPPNVNPAIGSIGNPPIRGPVGLGFRVPTLVLSPYSVGGLVCSDTFDHTSTLRFIERRFGVTVPNLSTWRRANTGDMTSAINFAAGRQPTPPAVTSPQTVATAVADLAKVVVQCPANALADQAGSPPPYPIPRNQAVPSQPAGSPKRPSGPVVCAT